MIILRNKNFGLVDDTRNKIANNLLKSSDIKLKSTKGDEIDYNKIKFKDKEIYNHLINLAKSLKIKLENSNKQYSNFDRSKNTVFIGTDSDCFSLAHEIGSCFI